MDQNNKKIENMVIENATIKNLTVDSGNESVVMKENKNNDYDVSEYERDVLNLSEEQMNLRTLHYKKIANGEIQAVPLKEEWLNMYDKKDIPDEAILATMPKETIYDYVFNKNKNRMWRPALYYFGNVIKFGKLKKMIDICVRSYIEMGIRPDDVVTICMPNTPEAIIAILALNKMGAVASMVNAKCSAEEIKHSINQCNSKMLITIDKCYDGIQKIKDETCVKTIVNVHPSDSMSPIIKLGYKLKYKNELVETKDDDVSIEWKSFFQKGVRSRQEIISAKFDKNRTAVIMRSGGTTGEPKLVELTDYNINSMIEQFVLTEKDFKPGEKMLAVMPVFHGFGLVSSILLPLTQGVGVILIPDPKKVDLLKIINKELPEHILGVPTLFNGLKMKTEKIIEESKGKITDFSKVLNLKHVKNLVFGGDASALEKEIEMQKFLEKCGMDKKKKKSGFGLTEAVAGVTFSDEIDNIGKPMVKTYVKIVDVKTRKEVEPGEVGEIWIYSPSVMKGYYNNPEATRIAKPDKWLNTGDLGYRKDNKLYFTQRKGDMIISSGNNIYPNIIENIISEHPAINKCLVIGKKDDYRGEVPKAFVILNKGYQMSEELSKEIKEFCGTKMEKHAVPVEIEERESFPETKLGKESRSLLKLEEDAIYKAAKEAIEQKKKLASSNEEIISNDNLYQSETEKTKGR